MNFWANPKLNGPLSLQTLKTKNLFKKKTNNDDNF